MKIHNGFRNSFLFVGISGVTFFYAFNAIAQESIPKSTQTVVPTKVDLNELPSADSFRQNSVEYRIESPAPRIPIGKERLQEIKRNPASAPKGSLLPESQARPVTVKQSQSQEGTLSISRLYNCNGNASTGSAPSDSHGAIGRNGYVAVTNVDLGVYSRSSCTKLREVSLRSFFGITDALTTAFDPRAAYDPVNNRYVVTAETRKTNSTDQYQYFAVSQTDNPAGSYFVYRLRLSDTTGTFCKKAASDFWDYPNLGYNSAQWFLTANVFPTSSGAYGAIMTIDKAPTLTGGSTTLRCFGTGTFAVQFNTAPPIVRTRGTTAYFLSPGSGSGNTLKKYTLNTSTNTLSGPANINLPNAWTAPPDASQPGVTQKLDTLDGRFVSASVQIGTTLWNVHAINFSGRALNKVYKVDARANTSALAVFLQSSGTAFNWNPSFVTGSTLTNNPGFLTWSSTDPTNNLRASMDMLTGPNSSSSNWSLTRLVTSAQSCTSNPVCRWGDYSSTTLDPLNANQAFGINQFLTGTSQFNWNTRIGGVSFF